MNCRRIAGIASENALRLAAGFALTVQSSLGWAQQSEQQTFPYGGHMMWGGGWLGMLFGLVSMFLLLVAVIGGIGLVARWFGASRDGGQSSQPPSAERTPLDILKGRYARGEIDKEEFEERRRVLDE